MAEEHGQSLGLNERRHRRAPGEGEVVHGKDGDFLVGGEEVTGLWLQIKRKSNQGQDKQDKTGYRP